MRDYLKTQLFSSIQPFQKKKNWRAKKINKKKILTKIMYEVLNFVANGNFFSSSRFCTHKITQSNGKYGFFFSSCDAMNRQKKKNLFVDVIELENLQYFNLISFLHVCQRICVRVVGKFVNLLDRVFLFSSLVQ